MPQKIVEVEGLGILEFPEETPDEVIDATVKREIAARNNQPQTPPAAKPTESEVQGQGDNDLIPGIESMASIQNRQKGAGFLERITDPSAWARAAYDASPLPLFEKENLPSTLAGVAGGVAGLSSGGLLAPAAYAAVAGALGQGGVSAYEGKSGGEIAGDMALTGVKEGLLNAVPDVLERGVKGAARFAAKQPKKLVLQGLMPAYQEVAKRAKIKGGKFTEDLADDYAEFMIRENAATPQRARAIQEEAGAEIDDATRRAMAEGKVGDVRGEVQSEVDEMMSRIGDQIERKGERDAAIAKFQELAEDSALSDELIRVQPRSVEKQMALEIKGARETPTPREPTQRPFAKTATEDLRRIETQGPTQIIKDVSDPAHTMAGSRPDLTDLRRITDDEVAPAAQVRAVSEAAPTAAAPTTNVQSEAREMLMRELEKRGTPEEVARWRQIMDAMPPSSSSAAPAAAAAAPAPPGPRTLRAPGTTSRSGFDFTIGHSDTALDKLRKTIKTKSVFDPAAAPGAAGATKAVESGARKAFKKATGTDAQLDRLGMAKDVERLTDKAVWRQLAKPGLNAPSLLSGGAGGLGGFGLGGPLGGALGSVLLPILISHIKRNQMGIGVKLARGQRRLANTGASKLMKRAGKFGVEDETGRVGQVDMLDDTTLANAIRALLMQVDREEERERDAAALAR